LVPEDDTQTRAGADDALCQFSKLGGRVARDHRKPAGAPPPCQPDKVLIAIDALEPRHHLGVRRGSIDKRLDGVVLGEERQRSHIGDKPRGGIRGGVHVDALYREVKWDLLLVGRDTCGLCSAWQTGKPPGWLLQRDVDWAGGAIV